MSSEDDVRARAQTFAESLDRNDFEMVATMLAPTCRYDLTGASLTSEGTLVGPDAILASYRSHDTRARRLFDSVEYSSVVEAVDGKTAVIRFTDVLEKSGAKHAYTCRQRITVDEQCQIDTIVQEDIPEEMAAVRGFLERVGVSLELNGRPTSDRRRG
jgi:hypothetical protein